jgi:hypothetical protein
MRPSRPRTLPTLVAVSAVVLAVTGCGSEGQPTGPTAQFCSDYATFTEAAFLEDVDTEDVASVLTALDTMVQDAKQIRPPEEIASAWTTVFQASQDHVQLMRGVDWSSESAQQEYFASVEGFESEELTAATAEVEAFVAAECPS